MLAKEFVTVVNCEPECVVWSPTTQWIIKAYFYAVLDHGGLEQRTLRERTDYTGDWLPVNRCHSSEHACFWQAEGSRRQKPFCQTSHAPSTVAVRNKQRMKSRTPFWSCALIGYTMCYGKAVLGRKWAILIQAECSICWCDVMLPFFSNHFPALHPCMRFVLNVILSVLLPSHITTALFISL